MKAKNLSQKYPALWGYMKAVVAADLKIQNDIHHLKMTGFAASVIAHNAAFQACSYIDKVFAR